MKSCMLWPKKANVIIVHALTVLLICQQVSSNAGAEPAPNAVSISDAESQGMADPEADAQNRYRWPYGSTNMYSGASQPYPPQPYPPQPYQLQSNPAASYGPSACELSNQCCGMADRNCCFNGGRQRCYTVWDRKCDNEDRAECQLRVDRHCHDVQVRDCRIVTDISYRTFQITSCFQKPLTECFEYTRKVCSPTMEPKKQTISWVNQKLVPLAETEKTHCFNQKTVNCTTEVIQEKVTQQERREKKVTDNQKRCKMGQRRSPDQEVTVPVTRIVYNSLCYDVPRASCSQTPCQMSGYCSGNLNVCSTTEVATSTICPQPTTLGGAEFGNYTNPRGGCQQVQQPVCYNSGQCQPQYQQCCSTTTQRICRQVPQRVVEQVKQVVPGTITWQEECEDYPVDRLEYYYEPVEKLVNRTRDRCEEITQPHCHNYTIPSFGVTNETKRDDILVTLPMCHHTNVKDKFCHTFPNGDIGCRNTTIRKGFRINKVVCDQMVTKKECFNIPVAECRVGTSAKCGWLPRQVCQKTCSDSPFCQACDNFRNGPGFGSCATGSCPIYYPNDESSAISPTKWISGVIGNDDVDSGTETSGSGVVIEDANNNYRSGDDYYTNVDNADIPRRSYWNGRGYFPEEVSSDQAMPVSLAEDNQDMKRSVLAIKDPTDQQQS